MSDHYFHRLTLIHQTDLASANQIIQTQTMLPGSSGLFGGGIYFANTIEATNMKAHRTGVYLCADVYLGKTKSVSRDDIVSGNFNQASLIAQGYTAICGYRLRTGREFIVFDSNRVHNIKFILGQKPQAVFKINRERITLFFTSSKSSAPNISSSQNAPYSNGPFGYSCYLYYTLEDALAAKTSDSNETYFAADVFMRDFYKLSSYENVNSSSVPSSCQTMIGIKNGINYFIIRNQSLIKNIHYCGGKPWNT